MNKRLWKIIFAVLFLALPAASYGELITISISGYVTSVSDKYGNLEDKIHVNNILTGTYTFDSEMSDSNPSSTVGDYQYNVSPAGISLSCGGFVFKTDPANVSFLVEVGNDSSTGDSYVVISYNNLSLSNGVLVDYISWQLDDSTGTALSSDALPLCAPDLTKWQPWCGLYIDGERGGGYLIKVDITSATLIPEPATFLFLSCGLWFTRRLAK